MLQSVLLRNVVGFVIEREADGAPSSCTEFCSELLGLCPALNGPYGLPTRQDFLPSCPCVIGWHA